MLPPPPPPPVKPPKVDSYRDKLLNKFEKFEGSPSEEVEKKTKKSEDKDPNCFAEAEGSKETGYLIISNDSWYQ